MAQMVLPSFPADSTPINDIVSFCKRDGTVYYFHGSFPVFMHPEDDMRSFRMFTSQLVANGNCSQAELVRAFGIGTISMKRYVKQYRTGGPASFFTPPGRRGAPVLTPEVMAQAQDLLRAGVDRSEVARRLELKPNTLGKAIGAGRLVEPEKSPVAELASASTKSERSVEDAGAAAGMGTGCTRVVERVCASVGLLSEAPSRFEPALDVARGGVLWAVPALLANGLLHHPAGGFRLPAGFYSLIQVFVLLGFMALARIRTVEQLRYSAPGEWGALLGLDRIPEVRTLREKVKVLAQPEAVGQWSGLLSREWMEGEPDAAGVLYVDGHVRVYHGSQTALPRRYVSRERLCLRGTTDYWVNDQQGRPFFVVSTPFTDGLLAQLRDVIVPRLLGEVPHQPSDAALEADPYLSRFTLVFDREGYSPAFFAQMWEQRIACQTYHKYPKEPWALHEFAPCALTLPSGETVCLTLAERGTRLSNGLWVREIRKLTGSGHQVALVSTDYHPKTAVAALHMFARWSQENFIKYMMQHFGIDKLVEYETIAPDETKMVVNPAYRHLEGQIKRTAGILGRKRATFSETVLEIAPESPGETMTTWAQTPQAALAEAIELLQHDLEELKAQRKQTPKHIRYSQLPKPDQFRALAPTRKHFLDTIKMIAYRAETAMADILREHLAHPDETRTLLRELFTTDADLFPNETEGTLSVQLHHLANPLSDRAIRALAEQLNNSETLYPGTNLRLIFTLVSDHNP